MKILSFGHEKRVGKDLASTIVLEYLRTKKKMNNVRKAGFADKLKAVCHDLYGWAGLMDRDYYEQNQHLKDEIISELGKSPRQIWISFGNEVKNSTYPNTWLNYLLKNTSVDFLIISDMRFPNEAHRIQSLGGKVVKIVRPSIPHTSDAADDPLMNFENWDEVIINDGSIEQFKQKVIKLVK